MSGRDWAPGADRTGSSLYNGEPVYHSPIAYSTRPPPIRPGNPDAAFRRQPNRPAARDPTREYTSSDETGLTANLQSLSMHGGPRQLYDARRDEYTTRVQLPRPHIHQGPPGVTPSTQSQRPPQPNPDSMAQFRKRAMARFIKDVVRNSEMTMEEYSEKMQFIKLLKAIVQKIHPSLDVAIFGSVQNGFTVKNSDMDVCVYCDQRSDLDLKAELPEALNEILSTAQGFSTKLLTKTRIPIIKILGDPENRFRYGLSCDVGFDNLLAIHNTRLLATYAQCDPRVREMVLFVKHWSKRRQINSAYKGTLSSYGYVLLILHFLMNVAQPAVIPNLQRINPRGKVSLAEMECDGFNIWFSKEPQYVGHLNRWSSAELLLQFFRYYAYDFSYRNSVISIRSAGGILSKEDKGWTQAVSICNNTVTQLADRQTEHSSSQENVIKDRYILAIEDPFEISHNVGRTVRRKGLFVIRGEFMRAAKLMTLNFRKDVTAEFLEEAPDPFPSRKDTKEGAEEEEVEVEVEVAEQVHAPALETRVVDSETTNLP